MSIRRGDVVTVALQGDTGKPRPAVVIQSDRLPPRRNVLVVPFSSNLDDAPLSRMVIAASPANGLKEDGQMMFDRLASVQRDKCHGPLGRLTDGEIEALDIRLALVLGLLDAA